jgi:hypothetical protein
VSGGEGQLTAIFAIAFALDAAENSTSQKNQECKRGHFVLVLWKVLTGYAVQWRRSDGQWALKRANQQFKVRAVCGGVSGVL